MFKQYLYSYTDGLRTRYIYVSHENFFKANELAFQALVLEDEYASVAGFSLEHAIDTKQRRDSLKELNDEHYNLNLQKINENLQMNEPFAVVGGWVAD